MTSIDSAQLIAMFTKVADQIDGERDRLCELDGVIGDADHGIAMSGGFGAVREALAALNAGATDPTGVFNIAAKSFLNAVGASSGPLYATALMRAGASAKGKTVLDQADFVAAFQAMAKGIQDRGKAEPGEKTMVDAWLPAAEAAGAAQAAGKPLGDVLEAAVAASDAGAEATKQMIAGKGRSSRLGERALGHMDPGAASAVVIIRAMQEALKNG